jgi:hypothetical protein
MQQNHEMTEAELYRKAVINLEGRCKALEQEVKTENSLKYTAYKRIADLTAELNLLKSKTS